MRHKYSLCTKCDYVQRGLHSDKERGRNSDIIYIDFPKSCLTTTKKVEKVMKKMAQT